MKKCNTCGSNLSDSARSCYVCGSKDITVMDRAEQDRREEKWSTTRGRCEAEASAGHEHSENGSSAGEQSASGDAKSILAGMHLIYDALHKIEEQDRAREQDMTDIKQTLKHATDHGTHDAHEGVRFRIASGAFLTFVTMLLSPVTMAQIQIPMWGLVDSLLRDGLNGESLKILIIGLLNLFTLSTILVGGIASIMNKMVGTKACLSTACKSAVVLNIANYLLFDIVSYISITLVVLLAFLLFVLRRTHTE